MGNMRHSRFLSILACAVFCMALFTGCAVGEKKNSAQRTSFSDLSNEELLAYLENNSFFTDYYGDCGYMTETHEALGGIGTYDVNGPNNYRLSRDDLAFYVNDGDISYGYFSYAPEDKLYRVFDEELLAWRIENENFSDRAFIVSSTETVSSREEKEGKLYLETTYMDDGVEADYFKNFGIEIPENEYMFGQSVYDFSISKLVSGCKYFIKDGEKVYLDKIKRSFSKDLPEDAKALQNELENLIMGSDDKHTITIIVGKGTDREKEYTVTANSDVFLDAWIRDIDGRYDIYSDAEYTKIFKDDEDTSFIPFDEDRVLYMK